LIFDAQEPDPGPEMKERGEEEETRRRMMSRKVAGMGHPGSRKMF
jgi:hypothetical protein